MSAQFGLFLPISPTGDRPDNTLPGGGPGGHPSHPITLPPVPPGFPPIPDNTLPSGGARPSNPIFLPAEPDNTLPGKPPGTSGGSPDRPDNTLPMPPGTIWPPLNPGDGVQGKGLLLILVIGADGVEKFKWLVVDAPIISGPPVATPK
jgi:hypothetical protein